MQIVEYKDLVRICKNLNSKGKKIARFSTTGRLHEGHLQGIRCARSSADIVVVLFCYYLPRLRLLVEGGRSTPDYSSYRFSDTEILTSLGMVDYVCFKYNMDGMIQQIAQTRQLVDKEIPNLVNENIIHPAEARAARQLSVALRVSEDEIYAHESWMGDNNFNFKIASLIAKKHNLPINYKFYPIVRDSTNTPYQSRFLYDDEPFEIKKQTGYIFNHYKDKLLQDGKLNGTPFTLSLREADTLKIVRSLEPNKTYLFNASKGKIFDSIIINS